MEKPSFALKADEKPESQRYGKLLKKTDVHVHYGIASDASLGPFLSSRIIFSCVILSLLIMLIS